MEYKMLDKLREKYRKAAQKYGNKFFNSLDLEKRIQSFLEHPARSQATLEKFLTEEMLFFKQIEEKIEQKKQEAEKRNAPSRLDELVELRQKKMKQYPDRFFDPGASMQMRHFIGGFSQLYDSCLPASSYMFGGSYLWKEIRQITTSMERFYQPAGKPCSFLLKQYGQEARLLGGDARLQLDQKMMQTAGVHLYQFMLQCQQGLDDLTEQMKDQHIAFGPSEVQLLRNLWNGKNFTEATQEIVKQITTFLNDFGIYELVEFAMKNK